MCAIRRFVILALALPIIGMNSDELRTSVLCSATDLAPALCCCDTPFGRCCTGAGSCVSAIPGCDCLGAT